MLHWRAQTLWKLSKSCQQNDFKITPTEPQSKQGKANDICTATSLEKVQRKFDILAYAENVKATKYWLYSCRKMWGKFPGGIWHSHIFCFHYCQLFAWSFSCSECWAHSKWPILMAPALPTFAPGKRCLRKRAKAPNVEIILRSRSRKAGKRDLDSYLFPKLCKVKSKKCNFATANLASQLQRETLNPSSLLQWSRDVQRETRDEPHHDLKRYDRSFTSTWHVTSPLVNEGMDSDASCLSPFPHKANRCSFNSFHV